MALVANRRSVMTLFSSATDPESHRVRVVLAEKGITVEILDVAEYRIEKDWYDLVPALESRTEKTVSKARKMLRDSLTAGAEVFAAKPYFLSDEFSLVDATIVPMLWRLKHFEIDLPRQAKPVIQYAERMFERESFKASLSDSECEMME
jgi:RNA polymerase-associated protein